MKKHRVENPFSELPGRNQFSFPVMRSQPADFVDNDSKEELKYEIDNGQHLFSGAYLEFNKLIK